MGDKGEAGTSQQCWGREEALRASFRAKQLMEDVREDSDSGKEAEHKGSELTILFLCYLGTRRIQMEA
jgi:hypothetical protein